MIFDWGRLVRPLRERCAAGRSRLESLRASRAKRRATRRPIEHWPSVEPMEVRVLLSGTPTLTVVLGSVSMSEFGGGNGVSATVQRTDADLSQALTVSLQSGDTTEATVPASVVIP